jgi:hypothetical protein
MSKNLTQERIYTEEVVEKEGTQTFHAEGFTVIAEPEFFYKLKSLNLKTLRIGDTVIKITKEKHD